MLNSESWGVLDDKAQLKEVQQPFVTPVAGRPIGIIAVKLIYPKIPGNVANATTFKFPVDYEVIDVDIELLFAGDKRIEATIVAAAKKLEARGARAIIGACGYFANYQAAVKQAVKIPAFLSSLIQIPLIRAALKDDQQIAVFVANYEKVSDQLLSGVGADRRNCYFVDVGSLPEFQPIRHGGLSLDNGKLTEKLIQQARRVVDTQKNIGAVLLECSDLPPYSYAIQAAVNLPVFDFITLIDFVWHSVVQTPYYGYY